MNCTEKKRRFSLWIKPENSYYDLFSSLIGEISQKVSSFTFEPHITILSNVKGEEEDFFTKCREIANNNHCFTLNLNEIGYSDDFFRSLYLNVEKNDSIINLFNFSAKKMGYKETANYFPHLSLFYGTLQKNKKIKMIESMKINKKTELHISKLFLYDTTQIPSKWKFIESFPFLNN